MTTPCQSRVTSLNWQPVLIASRIPLVWAATSSTKSNGSGFLTNLDSRLAYSARANGSAAKTTGGDCETYCGLIVPCLRDGSRPQDIVVLLDFYRLTAGTTKLSLSWAAHRHGDERFSNDNSSLHTSKATDFMKISTFVFVPRDKGNFMSAPAHAWPTNTLPQPDQTPFAMERWWRETAGLCGDGAG